MAKKVHHTTPILVFWLLLVPVALIVGAIFDEYLDFKQIVDITGFATLAFMGFEYGADLIRNLKLPSGEGSVGRIGEHKILVIVWLTYPIIGFILVYVFKFKDVPIDSLIQFSGYMSILYISGNKANKMATVSGPVLASRVEADSPTGK